MPFQPENIASGSHPQNQIIQMAMSIESQIKEMLGSERPSAEQYEQALQDYFRDLNVLPQTAAAEVEE